MKTNAPLLAASWIGQYRAMQRRSRASESIDTGEALELLEQAAKVLREVTRKAGPINAAPAMLGALTAAEDRLATLIDAEEATKADEKALREVRAAIRAAKGDAS